MSDLWKVKIGEVGKSLVSAVIAAGLFAVWNALSATLGAPNFDLFTTDWKAVLTTALNAGFVAGYTAFIGTIGQYFTRDKNGAILGRWGGKK